MKPIEIVWPFKGNLCIWPFIFYSKKGVGDKCVRVHEEYHWHEQRKGYVIPWLIVYGLLIPRYGMGRRHPLEKAAYRAEDACRE